MERFGKKEKVRTLRELSRSLRWVIRAGANPAHNEAVDPQLRRMLLWVLAALIFALVVGAIATVFVVWRFGP